MATNIGSGDYVPDTYPCVKLHYVPIRGFCPHMCEVAYQMFIQLVLKNCFWVLPTCYRLGHCADFDDQYVKRRCFAQGCAFWGSREQIFTFWSIFAKKLKIFRQFSMGLTKFQLKMGFNKGISSVNAPYLACVFWPNDKSEWLRQPLRGFVQ